MARRNSPPPQDVAKLIGPTEEVTVKNIIEFWQRPVADWNYLSVLRRLSFIIEHCQSEEQAADTCARCGSPVGRPFNQDVAKIVFREYGDSRYQCHPLKSKALELCEKPAIYTTVPPGVILVSDRIAKIVLIQTRKNFIMSNNHLALYAWFAARAHSMGDYAELPMEILETSADESGSRFPRKIPVSSLPKLDTEETLEKVAMFLRAFDKASELAPRDKRPRKAPEEVEKLPLFPDL